MYEYFETSLDELYASDTCMHKERQLGKETWKEETNWKTEA
jgi:hypothetical protein